MLTGTSLWTHHAFSDTGRTLTEFEQKLLLQLGEEEYTRIAYPLMVSSY